MVCVGVLGSGLSLRSAAVPPLGQSSSLIPTNRKSWLTTVAYCKSTTTRATSGVLTHACTYTHNLCLHPVVVTLRNVVGSQHHLAHMVTGFHFCLYLYRCVYLVMCCMCVFTCVDLSLSVFLCIDMCIYLFWAANVYVIKISGNFLRKLYM